MNEAKEILGLIAELARAAAAWDGGSYEGAVYTSSQWRQKLSEIAEKAERLALQESDGPA